MTSKSKEFKMHRATADRLKQGLIKRIQEYNDRDTAPFCITRAVIFGSYVNDPGREMISDLDVGIEMETRFEQRKISLAMFDLEYHAYIAEFPSWEGRIDEFFARMDIAKRVMMKFLRNGSHYISLHVIGVDEAIFDKEIEELDVGPICRTHEWYDEVMADGDSEAEEEDDEEKSSHRPLLRISCTGGFDCIGCSYRSFMCWGFETLDSHPEGNAWLIEVLSDEQLGDFQACLDLLKEEGITNGNELNARFEEIIKEAGDRDKGDEAVEQWCCMIFNRANCVEEDWY